MSYLTIREQVVFYLLSLEFLYIVFRVEDHGFLRRRTLEVGDQLFPLVLLLETREHHLRARNVLLRVLEVLKQGILTPGDA
jgi:hypothetical protein